MSQTQNSITINNFRFDANSCGPSKYWQALHFNHEHNQFQFPFASDEIIKHVRNAFSNLNSSDTNTNNQSSVIFSDSLVRGIYMFGSRVSKTNVHDSDFDLLMIVDQFYSHCQSSETRYSNNLQYCMHTSIICGGDGGGVGGNEEVTEHEEHELEIHVMETSFFVEHVYSQLPIFMLSVLQPNSSFVLFEDEQMKLWRHHWSLWFLRTSRTRNSFLHELNYCHNKAFRFWTALEKKRYRDESDRKSTLKKVKKNLAHGIRYCKLAYQMVNSGAIYDYTETNTLYDNIVFNTDSFTTWEEYKQISEQLYNEMGKQFKGDMKNITKDALSKIQNLSKTDSSSLTIVNFLNTYSEGFEKENPLFNNNEQQQMSGAAMEHDYQLGYSHHYKYGPFSLMRVLSINVTPILRSEEEKANPNHSKLFKLDLDMDYLTLELCKVFLKSNIFLECNGTVLSYNQDENGKMTYFPVCVPRFYSMDFNFIMEKIGGGYFTDIDISSLQAFQIPLGMKCSLFYHDGEWRFVFDNEKDNWVSKWITKNFDMSSTENEFKVLFEKLGMCYPSHLQDQNYNFFFIYQRQSSRIIFCGCRNLENLMECANWMDFSDKYCWKDCVQPVSIRDFMELQEYVNDSTQLSPLEFEGVEFINYKQPNKCFTMKSSIHSNVPYLRICIAKYLISKLDQHVLDNPPVELVSSKYNDTKLVASIMQSKFNAGDQDVENEEELLIHNLNPLFVKPFREFKKSYLQLCESINNFYNNQLLSIEDDIKQFNTLSKGYLKGNCSGLFHNLKKFRRDSQQDQIDAVQYWRCISYTNRINPSTANRTINFQEVKQVIELLSIFQKCSTTATATASTTAEQQQLE